MRNRNPPSYLANYVSNIENGDFINNVDFCYVLNVPNSFEEAMQSDDKLKWQLAMDAEIKSLEVNNTFTLTKLPEDKKLVGGRWVYDIKGKPENPIYKARYVAKGYSQVYGSDYFETFSPTPRIESIRVLMQLAVNYDLMLQQMDVKSAFLHAPIECDIYVSQPRGYEKFIEENLVWKLNKSLYGLKQSGRNWHNLLDDFLCDLCFIRSNADPCVYVKNDEEGIVIILVWVDDIIIASNSILLMKNIKEKLKENFRMKDLGELSTFLGIQFDRNDSVIKMNQSYYLKNVLKKFEMENVKPRSTPCEINLSSYETDDSTDDVIDERKYREIVGSLVYAMVCTRPDLCYVVTKLSQHLSKPTSSDWVILKHVFQYIKGTIDYGLTFRKSDLNLFAFCDADWASTLDNRRSISGYCFMLSANGPAISWKSKKQKSVALSTCEAEYMALSATCQEVAYLCRLLKDIVKRDFEPVTIKNDNQGAIALCKNPVKHMQSKHIDIRYHFVRDYYQSKKINLEYVPSNENVADVFTKPVRKPTLLKLKNYLFCM